MAAAVRISIGLCVLVAACVRTPDGKDGAATAPGASLDQAAPSIFVSEETALLEVALRPDGTATLRGISPRPIPYRGQRLVPFDPTLYESTATSTPVAPPTAPGGRTDGTVTPDTALPQTPTPTPAHPIDRGGVLVVRHASLKTPLVVPLTLGQPGEGGGDVTDRWQQGTVIVRGPYFGPGTRYTLVRLTEHGPRALAEREVAP